MGDSPSPSLDTPLFNAQIVSPGLCQLGVLTFITSHLSKSTLSRKRPLRIAAGIFRLNSRIARKELMKAHARLNEYLDSRVAPDDLKRSG